jgi:hypothetical protein
MKIAQYHYNGSQTWKQTQGTEGIQPDLLFVFGQRQVIEDTNAIAQLREKFPQSQLIGCSTAGEILDDHVYDGTITATAVKFEKSNAILHQLVVDNADDSYAAGKKIVSMFNPNNLRHLFVLTDGLVVNGSEFVRGMQEELPQGVSVTGGLAGDGPDFGKTVVFTHDAKPGSNIIAAIGLYGENLKMGYASMGGWDSFGIERLVTSSNHNVLYELDGQPALDLYKSFLGDQASGLPASGLLFPLSIRTSGDERPIVRTILAVNEQENSMTFAGDIPQGSYVRLMKANVDRLIDGSMEAAEKSMIDWDGQTPELAILISCVGRKLVLKQMVEEEVETAKAQFGNDAAITGFYSYGEISPFMKFLKCELHNQTMTITLIRED